MHFIYKLVSEYKDTTSENLNYYTHIFSYICDCIHLEGDTIEICESNNDIIVQKLLEPYKKNHHIAHSIEELEKIDGQICFAYIDKIPNRSQYIREILGKMPENGIVIFNNNGKLVEIRKNIPIIEEIVDIKGIEKWSLVYHNWGDMIIELGILYYYMGESDIVFNGKSKDMIDFLKAQNFIKNIIDIRHYNLPPLAYNAVKMHKIIRNKYPNIKIILNCAYWSIIVKSNMLPKFNLPENSKQYANNFFKPIKEKTIIIHPFSIASGQLKHHWAYWDELMEFLFCKFPQYTFILTGLDWDSSKYSNLPNVINLIDKIPTNCHNFALTNLTNYIITTADSTSQWIINQKLYGSIIKRNNINFFPWTIIYDCHIGNSEILQADRFLISNCYAIYKKLQKI
jgi:hypothetical protein